MPELGVALVTPMTGPLRTRERNHGGARSVAPIFRAWSNFPSMVKNAWGVRGERMRGILAFFKGRNTTVVRSVPGLE